MAIETLIAMAMLTPAMLDDTQAESGVTDLALSSSQRPTRKVSVNFNNASVKDVLKWMTSQGFDFMASDNQLPKDARVTLHIENEPLGDVLDALGMALGGHWTQKGKIYVFNKGAGSFYTSPDGLGGFGGNFVPFKTDGKGGAFQFNGKDWKAIPFKTDGKGGAFQFDGKDWKAIPFKTDGKGGAFQFDGKDWKAVPFRTDGKGGAFQFNGKDWKAIPFKTDGKGGAFEFDGKEWKTFPGMKDGDWEKFGQQWEKWGDDFGKQFGPEFQKKMEKYKGKDEKDLTPEEKKQIREEMQKEFGPEFQKKFKDMGDMMRSQFGPEFQKKWQEDSKKWADEGRAWSVKGQNFTKIFDSLTPDQRSKHEKQGYLLVSDLTPEQRKMLGDVGDNFSMTIIKDGKKLSIRSKRP